MKKFLRAGISIAIFIVTISIVYVGHIRYFVVDVVFYSALIDGIVATIVTGIILWKIRYFSLFNNFERVLLIVIYSLAGYSLAISVPTVIDRSLSFYILEKIHQRGGGIRLDAFEYVFTNEYVREHRLVEVRLTEQIKSGTIEIKNDCVILTEKGESIAEFSRFFRQHWLSKNRLLMGKYTDELTDPFKNSLNHVNYECK